MRAMILAAGRGSRMGHLTDHTPKPLLKWNDRFLIEYSIVALAKIHVTEIVINVSYLKDQIKSTLRDGKSYGVNIIYSEEDEALETGGGIFKALPLLGDNPFIVLSADVVSDYPLENLPKNLKNWAHLVLVDNPSFLPQGDFAISGSKILNEGPSKLTYANIGIYSKELFSGCNPGKFALGPLLRKAVDAGKVSGEYYEGHWCNFGTEDQLVKYAAI